MQKEEETILKEILWGERPLHHLSFLKIGMFREGGGYRLENTRDLHVTGGPYDVARGLLRYRNEPVRLAEWAALVLNTPELFGLELSRSQEGRVFEEALGEAAGGGKVTPEVFERARALVPAFPKKRALSEPEQYGPPIT